MAKPLTPEQVLLVADLKAKRAELHELARVKQKQANDALMKYTKLISHHSQLVRDHDKTDRILFLLAPGIKMLESEVKRAERKAKARAIKPKAGTLAASLGSSTMEAMVAAAIAKRKSELGS